MTARGRWADARHTGGGTATLDRSDGPDPDYPNPLPDEFAITPDDVREALGADADRLMAEADIDIHELIQLINAETTVLPPLDELPAYGSDEEDTDALAQAGKRWKQRFLRGAALAVLITLSGGGAAAVAMNKSVTLEVDGNERTVNTYADTVGEVLEDEGLDAGKHDALSPSPQAPVGDGGKVVLERGRQLQLTVDGEQRQSWVRATTVREALSQLGLSEKGVWTSENAGAEIPLDGMALEVKTPKDITLYDGGKQPQRITTNAVTIAELLSKRGLSLGPEDELEAAGPGVKLNDGSEVRISRTGVTVINEKEEIEPPVEEIEDPDMLAGKEQVLEEGVPGEEMVTYRVTERNGDEVDREELNSKVLTEAEPKVVKVGTKQPEISNAAVWDRLAQCESGGNWSINTGNGFYGGLQFDSPTWSAYGGDQYASLPHQASRAQQISIAEKVRDDRGGYGAWPSCSSQLGLR